jgi:hypothetical protein
VPHVTKVDDLKLQAIARLQFAGFQSREVRTLHASCRDRPFKKLIARSAPCRLGLTAQSSERS